MLQFVIEFTLIDSTLRGIGAANCSRPLSIRMINHDNVDSPLRKRWLS